MGLYENIKDVAKSKGYSINSLEKEMGFARSSIRKFNDSAPSIKKLMKLANFLNVSLEELTGGMMREMPQEELNEINAIRAKNITNRYMRDSMFRTFCNMGKSLSLDDLELVTLMMMRLLPNNGGEEIIEDEYSDIQK